MLKGTLDDFTLPDIFRLLSMAKRTGTLEVTRSAGAGKVFFRSGDVYFAQSSLTREPLGRKLIRARAVTEGQLMKALDEHASGGRRVGEILVAAELVTLEQLETAVREQIEDSVFDLLRWDLGEFEWEAGSEVEAEVPIAVSVENLIMEASRRLDELEVITRKIPSVEAVLRMAPKPPEDAVEINITPEEWRILVLVDGTRSVAEIAEAVALDEFGAMRVLYGLVSAGLIELAPESAGDEAAPAADAPAFSLAVDLSPHRNGDAEPPAPPEDLSDELPESLMAGLSDGPIDLDTEPEMPVDAFDPPGRDELVTSLPFEDDPVAVGAPAAPEESPTPEPVVAAEPDETPAAEPDETPAAEPDESPAAESHEGPAAEAGAAFVTPDEPELDMPQPSIDRAAVVRELAGLFNDDDRPRAQRAAVDPDRPATPHRVEDDDQITKGLISRLIDGVKGL